AIRDKRIAENPCEGVKLPRRAAVSVNEDDIPSLDQVHAIADKISNQYKLSVWLMAGAGLRISEALAFSTKCNRGDFLRISQQVSSKANQGDCRTRLVPLKHRAEGEYRDVPLPPFLADEIKAHVDRWGTVSVQDVDVLFSPRERGKGVMPTASTYGYHWHKALKAAGLLTSDEKNRYTPHGLRHFFASTALGGNVPILEVSRWLGHKSIKITADVYGHLTPDASDRFRAVMQEALRPRLQLVA
ncbi:MAG: site-specific integrase, partial [Umezawaea sp.]